jgi:ubiquinone/menaquinone biosynthesis C-methylase UbiE
MVANKWHTYSDLAWTEPIVAPPEEYVKETELFIKEIKGRSKTEVRTLLHLGCGAGGNDYTFKKAFKVTGVDISEHMLSIAKQLNPDVVYHHGDMRAIELKAHFDAVAIPDSIGYMTTIGDLRSALVTSYRHLKPNGTLLIVAYIAEHFRENNFIYTGSGENVEITVFENNHIPDPTQSIYEATIIYLIRKYGKLEIYTDLHQLGIFSLGTWLNLLKKVGFVNIKQVNLDHAYDRYLFGEGEYPLLIFVCFRP